MKKILSMGLLLTVFISCSKVEEFEKKSENIEKNTTDLSSKMDTTNENMDDMNQTMEGMDANAANLYRQMRQKESNDTRDKEWKILMDENTKYNQKRDSAKVYLENFEYQLWTNEGFDNEKVRTLLFQEAVDEFYRVLNDEFKQFKDVPRSLIDKSFNKNMAIYALAVELDAVHIDQALTLEKYPKVQRFSMLSIIEQALEKFNMGVELNDYERVVVSGDNEEVTRILLRARDIAFGNIDISINEGRSNRRSRRGRK